MASRCVRPPRHLLPHQYVSSLPYVQTPTLPHTTVLIRIVRMTFHPDAVDTFLTHFDRAAPEIRRFPGCMHLELWQEVEFPNRCTTYSRWRDEKALDAYRDSDLFRSTWRAVKPLFAAPPRAFSSRRLRADADLATDASG